MHRCIWRKRRVSHVSDLWRYDFFWLCVATEYVALLYTEFWRISNVRGGSLHNFHCLPFFMYFGAKTWLNHMGSKVTRYCVILRLWIILTLLFLERGADELNPGTQWLLPHYTFCTYITRVSEIFPIQSLLNSNENKSITVEYINSESRRVWWNCGILGMIWFSKLVVKKDFFCTRCNQHCDLRVI